MKPHVEHEGGGPPWRREGGPPWMRMGGGPPWMRGEGGGPPWMRGEGGPPWMRGGRPPFPPFLPIVVLVLGGMFVAKRMRKMGPPPHLRADPALDVLRERYARGEIEREEYEKRAQFLASTAPSRGCGPR